MRSPTGILARPRRRAERCATCRKLAADYTTQLSAFVTAFYGIYNPTTRSLVYASAGHNPPRHLRSGAIGPLDAVDGVPLGVADDADFPDEVLRLKSGDTIVFYTDGIVEAFNPSSEQFGLERLDGLIIAHEGSPSVLAERIMEELGNWTNHQPLDDDCTLVVARVT